MRITLVSLSAAVVGLGVGLGLGAAHSASAGGTMPVVTDWSGVYVGGNGGYAWADGVQLGHLDDNPQGVSPQGVFGGGQIGYNYQINNLVLGIEADIQAAAISDSVIDANFGDKFSSSLKWFGTARVRLGAVINPWLLYVTGGFAYGRIVSDVTNPLLLGAPYHFDGTATGYALGGGVEYRLDPAWSIKAEYLRIDLGTNDPTNAAGTTFSSALAREILKASAFNAIRIGLNYRFR